MLGVSAMCRICERADSLSSAELQQVDEDHSVVRYKFAFQWCEGQGDPWWAQGTEPTPTATQARSLLRDSQPGITISEEQGNLTSGRCLSSWSP
jgi:hypothetical protein